ncbi:N-acetylmuramic acid-6-phosphate etherase, partial [mine drainage metagenome]
SGGPAAITHSIENVEDDAHSGAQAILDNNIGPNDVVLGIAAGGTTPYVHGAVEQSRKLGAKTVFLACTAREHIAAVADLYICLPTGPEVLAGSTRLKAGTATKLVLNTITTLTMVKLGKVFGNLMVDLDASKNSKLHDRATRIIIQITRLDRDAARQLLHSARGNVKRALVM